VEIRDAKDSHTPKVELAQTDQTSAVHGDELGLPPETAIFDDCAFVRCPFAQWEGCEGCDAVNLGILTSWCVTERRRLVLVYREL
jgi:hypothetical protein